MLQQALRTGFVPTAYCELQNVSSLVLLKGKISKLICRRAICIPSVSVPLEDEGRVSIWWWCFMDTKEHYWPRNQNIVSKSEPRPECKRRQRSQSRERDAISPQRGLKDLESNATNENNASKQEGSQACV